MVQQRGVNRPVVLVRALVASLVLYGREPDGLQPARSASSTTRVPAAVSTVPATASSAREPVKTPLRPSPQPT